MTESFPVKLRGHVSSCPTTRSSAGRQSSRASREHVWGKSDHSSNLLPTPSGRRITPGETEDNTRRVEARSEGTARGDGRGPA
ncbi:hypothetical protein RRG08_048018 [Elysia crispata]|uniref:Uncharacterized protein n=1 Tax=Elysia crispata TaxID=231223 RepID=A0AAE0XRU1_9GAST|nr:hypothetical protein RRG08_048018 [Elysia crispata]